jgi:hypothetical protein
MTSDRLAATGSLFGAGKFSALKRALAQLLIGIAGGICSYGWLGGFALLGSGHGTNHPKSQCCRCDCANDALHEFLPCHLLTRSLPNPMMEATIVARLQ